MSDLLADALSFLTGSTAVILAVVTALFNADTLISKRGRELIQKLIDQSIQSPERSEIRSALAELLRSYFGKDTPAWHFFATVAGFTLASLAVVLVAYLFKTPGFYTQLTSNWTALLEFAKQFLLNGFIVTFVVNYVAFSAYALVLRRFAELSLATGLLTLVGDVVVKILLFILVTGLTYLAFATAFGSFGGDVRGALDAVIPTIEPALRFENLTGVYLYSVTMSSLPIFLVVVIGLLAASPRLKKLVVRLIFWLPFEDKPVRFMAVVLGIFIVVFYQLARAVIAVV